ncbi:MAG: sugar transferase [Alphaproteobacteria bacterium]
MFIEETHGYALRPNGWLNRVAALFLIAYCAPLIAVLALAVRVESDGPVFVRSKTDGQDILRFRTTTVDEPQRLDASSRTFVSGDATGFGVFLQKSRLGFLPRLWNVAAGEHSISALFR